jgi:hypothetical protein
VPGDCPPTQPPFVFPSLPDGDGATVRVTLAEMCRTANEAQAGTTVVVTAGGSMAGACRIDANGLVIRRERPRGVEITGGGFVVGGEGNTIAGFRFVGAGVAVALHGNGNRVLANEIVDGAGKWFEGAIDVHSSGNLIEGNRIVDTCQMGVRVTGPHRHRENVIKGNHLSNSEQCGSNWIIGIQIGQSDDHGDASSDTLVLGNILEGVGRQPISLKASGVEVRENFVVSKGINKAGIGIRLGRDNKLIRNTIIGPIRLAIPVHGAGHTIAGNFVTDARIGMELGVESTWFDEKWQRENTYSVTRDTEISGNVFAVSDVCFATQSWWGGDHVQPTAFPADNLIVSNWCSARTLAERGILERNTVRDNFELDGF